MKFGFLGLLTLVFILAVSCPSAPETKKPDEPQPGAAASSAAAPETFDASRVTQQEYASTMQDVRVFIEELNRIIAARNYQQWRARLSPEYFAEISSPGFLHQVSEQPAMKTRMIVLRTAEEYFIHVVVPSRQNSRVDSIEFIGRDKVIAYTVNINRAGEEVRLRLYDLERKDNSWIIIN